MVQETSREVEESPRQRGCVESVISTATWLCWKRDFNMGIILWISAENLQGISPFH